jgi:hypothetical protein
MPDGHLAGSWEPEPSPPLGPWAPLVRQVEKRLLAGATARVVGPYVEVRLEGMPLILTSHGVYEAALMRLKLQPD